MAYLLLAIKKERINNEIKKTAQVILQDVEEYWVADFKPPPIVQIKFNLEKYHGFSPFLFEEAISYLINEGLIELDVSDMGVERIAQPLTYHGGNRIIK
jgi:hypothetical protein